MGAWTEIVDYTWAANETSRTFTGLNITKDDFIKVVFTSIKPSTSGGNYSLHPNNDLTTTNYYRQWLGANGSSIFTGRINDTTFGQTPNNSSSTTIGYIKLSESGHFNQWANTDYDLTTPFVYFNYVTSTPTYNSISSLTILADAANTIGTGSRIQIYRLDAEKVADITVASNTTQVDISNLSIDKDSEYLLVSNLANSSGGTADYWLTPNDLTTTNQYYVQRLIGNGTSAGALRTNEPRYTETWANTSVVAYSHIKLSEIGAYTLQNYGLGLEGTNTPIIFNYFVSSTAENITSITKLNIKSAASNQIGAGTRFILYKLK